MTSVAIVGVVLFFFTAVMAIMFAGAPWYIQVGSAALAAMGLGKVWQWLCELPPEMRDK